ncbi:MAG: cysteine synthase family protein, partial [Clostridia bacterium]|nr:cysteine synthase family protein [Clostridia bacterium]
MKCMMDTLGNTPLVFVDEVNGNKIYAKLEYYNPTGSIKDRPAYYMIKKALERGDIKEGATIIEPTSGNTGIGLAFMCARMGMKAILTLPESMSLERRQILAALGAELVLTPKALGMQGAIDKAEELHKAIENSFVPNQFSNPDNALAHYETTAPEIFSQLKVDFIVDGIGSGGTLMGISKFVKDNKIPSKIVGIEPFESPLITKGVAGSHGIQGIGANFIPKLLDKNLIDIMLL